MSSDELRDRCGCSGGGGRAELAPVLRVVRTAREFGQVDVGTAIGDALGMVRPFGDHRCGAASAARP